MLSVILMRLGTHCGLPVAVQCNLSAVAAIALHKQLMQTRQNRFKLSPSAVHALNPASSSDAEQQTEQAASSQSRPQVIIITGPTAVGKTKLGLELAKRIGGEIISADSVQVYRGLDIGSDKLPLEQREGIPHHLIDILDPAAEFSAGDFHQLGRAAAEDVLARGKVPIVAGGTGFYLRWFVYGKPSTPASSPESAAKALELIGQAWQQAAAQVATAQQELLLQQQQQPAQPQGCSHTEQQGQPIVQKQPAGAQGQLQLNMQHVDIEGVGSETSAAQAGLDNPNMSPNSTNSREPDGQPQPFNQELNGQQTEVTQQLSTHTAGTRVQPSAAPAVEQLAAKLPAVSAEAAEAALQLSEEQRWDVAVAVVQQLGDHQTATRIRAERNNWYRLQRVLQILVQNGGKPLSELDVDTTRDLDYDFRCFFLHRPRLELFDRIIYRVEEMVAGGLLSEALMLLDQGMQPNSNIATRAIGYRQAAEFMQAALAKGHATKEELQQLIYDIATASRNLVKNQTTWFRDDAMFRWVEVSNRSTEEVLQEVLSELDKPQHEGGCGDSGRFDKQTLAALKRYAPSLKLFNDPGRIQAVLDWVAEAAAARQKGPVTGHAGVTTDVVQQLDAAQL